MRQKAWMNKLNQPQNRPHRRARHRAEKQDRRHCVPAHRMLGAQIVNPKEECGREDFGDPAHLQKETGEPLRLARCRIFLMPPFYMWAIMLSPNCEHLISVPPSMRRAKS